MKKIISVAIVVAMLLSLLCVFAAIPASAAVEGMWNVYSVAGDYYLDDKEDDEFAAVPGYEYTDEGLRVIPADWTEKSPKVGVHTKDVVDLKEGVYFEVRIDDFTYSAGDKWFSISVADKPYAAPGNTNVAKYGESMTTLIRPDDNGKIAAVEWRYGAFQWSDRTSMTTPDEEKYDENGKPILALTITWDGTTYAMDINGAPAPDTTIAYMNEHYANGEAYVGINLMNTTKGGTAACTILKFGTSKDDAETPVGEDSAAPTPWKGDPIAEIADPSTVPAGQPAIYMNGSRALSDSKSSTGRNGTDETIKLNEDGTVHYTARSSYVEISFAPKNEISYSIDDFPVIMALTKNFCTCTEVDECMAFESADMYVITGEFIGADDKHKASEINLCYDPIFKDGDSYLYFYVDTSEDINWDAEGRFNGARLDLNDIVLDTPGRNGFDVCFMALFRSVEEAEAYVLNWIGVEEEDETDAPAVGDETDAPVGGDETDAPAGDETDAPAGNETDAPADDETNAPAGNETQTPDKGDDNNKGEANVPTTGDDTTGGGCGSFVGFGAIAVIALIAGVGFAAFKKERK